VPELVVRLPIEREVRGLNPHTNNLYKNSLSEEFEISIGQVTNTI
jgi:hypothetical protein